VVPVVVARALVVLVARRLLMRRDLQVDFRVPELADFRVQFPSAARPQLRLSMLPEHLRMSQVHPLPIVPDTGPLASPAVLAPVQGPAPVRRWLMRRVRVRVRRWLMPRVRVRVRRWLMPRVRVRRWLTPQALVRVRRWLMLPP